MEGSKMNSEEAMEEDRQEIGQAYQQDASQLYRANSQYKHTAGVSVNTTPVGTVPFAYQNVIYKSMEFIDIAILTSCPG